ncbi:hypothetical protein VPH35_031118 [Triticum aestivum]
MATIAHVQSPPAAELDLSVHVNILCQLQWSDLNLPPPIAVLLALVVLDQTRVVVVHACQQLEVQPIWEERSSIWLVHPLMSLRDMGIRTEMKPVFHPIRIVKLNKQRQSPLVRKI